MSPQEKIRVMVVDDSAVIRGLLTRTLESDPAISVVATVPNGQVALHTLGRETIDVVILDIEMPVMDGLTALPKLVEQDPKLQVIMASTLTRKNADVSIKALSLGAADYVTKPSSSSELHSADQFKRELNEKVKALGRARRAAQPGTPTVKTSAPAAATLGTPGDIKLRKASMFHPTAIAIASSTGGPQALLAVLGKLDPAISQPIFITQHMPPTFTTLLAEHIERASGRPCHEGQDGEAVRGGCIYVAPGATHMLIERDGTAVRIRLNDGPPENFCKPAADPMFRSLAQVYGARLFTVVLTGMGADGRKGGEDIVGAGGTIVAQDQASSVVWGMPGAVATAGLCSAVLPLAEIAGHMRRAATRAAA